LRKTDLPTPKRKESTSIATMSINYSVLSLVELKNHAKTLRIKQYYIMKRAQLIELLEMESLPPSFAIEKMTIHQLRDEAKMKQIKGFWSLKRSELVALLFPENVGEAPPNKNEKNQSEAKEHHQPNEHDPEDVWVENM
jgi:hypothetical protein